MAISGEAFASFDLCNSSTCEALVTGRASSSAPLYLFYTPQRRTDAIWECVYISQMNHFKCLAYSAGSVRPCSHGRGHESRARPAWTWGDRTGSDSGHWWWTRVIWCGRLAKDEIRHQTRGLHCSSNGLRDTVDTWRQITYSNNSVINIYTYT